MTRNLVLKLIGLKIIPFLLQNSLGYLHGGMLRQHLFLGLIVSAATYFLPVSLGMAKTSCPFETRFDCFQRLRKLQPEQSQSTSLMAVGDIMLGRNVGKQIEVYGLDYPFLKVQNSLKQRDIVFGNLEAPIVSGSGVALKSFHLRAEPGVEIALKQAGFTILSLANNHAMDFDARGLISTIDGLKSQGISVVGAGQDSSQSHRPLYVKRNGVTLAFLAYHDPSIVALTSDAGIDRPGTAFMDLKTLKLDIQSAKKEADVVIVSMHAGKEYQRNAEIFQKRFAHAAIDAGAGLVIGHHPHVLQPIEKYRGRWIFYSLGNFVFDQMQSLETRKGMIVHFSIWKNGKIHFSILPTFQDKIGQPKIVSATQKNLAHLKVPLSFRQSVIWNLDRQAYEIQSIATDSTENFSERPTKVSVADLDGDGTDEEIRLKDGQIQVMGAAGVLWKSSVQWWVDDFHLADVNQDGRLDLSFSVWKAGRFGTSRPFWITKNDPHIRQHFFVFDLRKDGMHPLWQSSSLPRPHCHTEIADLKGDGEPVVIFADGSYADSPNRCRSTTLSVWKWESWGFVRQETIRTP
jgi:poly-gamma-glutamate capsule biosynthesis protein CapA/YwtB (metallophosphatase superfamily)